MSHSTMLTHAERASRITELLELDSGSFQAISEELVMPSPEEYEETPRDEDKMSEHDEGSQQTNLFAAMSSWCPLWVLQRIMRAEVMLLCSPDRQENTRQFIPLAGSSGFFL